MARQPHIAVQPEDGELHGRGLVVDQLPARIGRQALHRLRLPLVQALDDGGVVSASYEIAPRRQLAEVQHLG